MFFDWLTMYQDYEFQLPILSDRHFLVIDTVTGDQIADRQPSFQHFGSFCTSIQIRISGNRVTMSGNPSRYDRLDNLFGFTRLEDCVAVYNRILLKLGLPPFTKCTNVNYCMAEETKRHQKFSDGAVIQELHITANRLVGEGCVDDYIKALSTQRYHNSIPRLHTNGKTTDWLSPQGNATFIYPSVYNKAHELVLHTLKKIEKRYGKDSHEFSYLQNIINYCQRMGVTRHELKLKSAFLRRHNFQYYGLFNPNDLKQHLNEFLNIDQKLQVTSMDIETITQKLINDGVCTNMKAANTTTLYALQWMHGHAFDLSKNQVKVHRARLRKIGIDIASTYDSSRHSPVYIKKATVIEVKELPIPDWYKMPEVQPALRLVA